MSLLPPLRPKFQWAEQRSAGKTAAIGLDKRTSRRIIEEELLIMNDLRTTGWEESGWRYANQPFGG